MGIVWFNYNTARYIKITKHVAKLGEVLEVFKSSITALTQVAHKRRTVNASKNHVVATDDYVLLWVACLQSEFTRRLCNLLQNPIRIELNVVAFNFLSSCAEKIQSALVHKLDTHFGNNASPTLIQDCHGILRKNFITWALVLEHKGLLLFSYPVTKLFVTFHQKGLTNTRYVSVRCGT